MKLIKNILIFAMLLLVSASCATRLPGPPEATAPVVVYKTKKDYRDYMTVQLSADGQTVTAFPAPSDVPGQKPVQLADGYLLKRMVGDAYLSVTIDDYANASRHYSSDELFKLVIDRDPYLEKYDCSGYTDTDTASINNLIRRGDLKKCKTLINK
jgi:hypothetical protein